MTYVKPLMKIAELVKMGFSKDQLVRYTHMPGSPCIRTGNAPNSHYLFKTEELDAWIEKQNKKSPYASRR